jgi:hypothetical protein
LQAGAGHGPRRPARSSASPLQCGGKAPSLVFADCEQSGAGRELGLAGLGEYVARKRIAFDAAPAFHLKTWWQRRD